MTRALRWPSVGAVVLPAAKCIALALATFVLGILSVDDVLKSKRMWEACVSSIFSVFYSRYTVLSNGGGTSNSLFNLALLRPETAEANGDWHYLVSANSSGQWDERALYGLVHVLGDFGFGASGARSNCKLHLGCLCGLWIFKLKGLFPQLPTSCRWSVQGLTVPCLQKDEEPSVCQGGFVLSDSFWSASSRRIISHTVTLLFPSPICSYLCCLGFGEDSEKELQNIPAAALPQHAWRLGDKSWRRWGHWSYLASVDLFVGICQVLFVWFVCQDLRCFCRFCCFGALAQALPDERWDKLPSFLRMEVSMVHVDHSLQHLQTCLRNFIHWFKWSLNWPVVRHALGGL